MEQNQQYLTAQTAEWNEKSVEDDDIKIDLGRIFRSLLHYWWIIVISAAFLGFLSFGFTKLFMPNQYEATGFLYVRNSSSSSGVVSSDQNPARVYMRHVTNQQNMSKLVKNLGLEERYSWKKMAGIIDVAYETGEAGQLSITVVHTDPDIAAKIANELLYILQENVVYDGLVFEVSRGPEVLPDYDRVSPNTFQNVILGALIGAVACCVVIVVIELLNNRIYNDEYLIETYNIPVLANIPDFENQTKKKKGYYQYYSYGNTPQQQG